MSTQLKILTMTKRCKYKPTGGVPRDVSGRGPGVLKDPKRVFESVLDPPSASGNDPLHTKS